MRTGVLLTIMNPRYAQNSGPSPKSFKSYHNCSKASLYDEEERAASPRALMLDFEMACTAWLCGEPWRLDAETSPVYRRMEDERALAGRDWGEVPLQLMLGPMACSIRAETSRRSAFRYFFDQSKLRFVPSHGRLRRWRLWGEGAAKGRVRAGREFRG